MVWKESLGEFDDYGQEMGPDARVWKTYVREADKFDNEQVDGWNKCVAPVIQKFSRLMLLIPCLDRWT